MSDTVPAGSGRPQAATAPGYRLALLVWGSLVLLTGAFGIASYYAHEEDRALSREQAALGLKFGCTDKYPIPASSRASGESGCYAKSTCNSWGRPSCDGLALDPRYVEAWDTLQTSREASTDRQETFLILAFSVGYAVGGWFAYNLLLAILRRFVLPKWALLIALLVNLVAMNVVGVVRAIVGLLNLPPHS